MVDNDVYQRGGDGIHGWQRCIPTLVRWYTWLATMYTNIALLVYIVGNHVYQKLRVDTHRLYLASYKPLLRAQQSSTPTNCKHLNAKGIQNGQVNHPGRLEATNIRTDPAYKAQI